MSRRVWVVGGLVAAAAVVGALAAGMLAKSDAPSHGALYRPISEAFARHSEDLFEAKGDAGEGPVSWAQQNYELNGGDAITAANISEARTAFTALQKRGNGQGKNSTTSWCSLGPTSAIYPAFLTRHHSQYVTSGRITALALTPDCTAQLCRLWVAAAGGGVWRTDKALAGDANWVNVSDGSFASGAIG